MTIARELAPTPAPSWKWLRLKAVAAVLSSNVDKLTDEREAPVRLCNYVDVYKNDVITGDITFMRATATPEQIARFSLHADDVIITKDSETPDDIAVPAYVDPSAEGVVCGYHLAVLRPERGRISGKYLFWTLRPAWCQPRFRRVPRGLPVLASRSVRWEMCGSRCPPRESRHASPPSSTARRPRSMR